ncbi:MAG: formylmethanofuran dehydrogenase subunit C [Planctomycetaceae bacterium]|nr:formylmethanofuran dehydrogenase subunit C [Planctomycetaceae bacterium]
MPLILELKTELTLSVEVDSIRLEEVQSLSTEEIAALPLQHGNQQVPLGSFFEVTGSAAEDLTMIWRGDCSRVKRIGTGLSNGTIRIEGHAGNHVGAEMTGGQIEIRGNAGDYAGAEMRGGTLTISGNAGNSLGATYRGATKGMRGGEIFVGGNAGNEVGRGLRRGLIAVQGDIGDAAGFKMLAGSLLLFGAAGPQLGAGMKRGSIVCFDSPRVSKLLPTFLPASRYHPLFLRFYLDRLREQGWAVPAKLNQQNFTRYCGDFASLGRGEILFAE